MDETGYCHGCLQLIEGITPGNKAAPGGPLYWAGWVYLAGESAWDFVYPLPQQRQESLQVKPFSTLDRVLFDNYRDLSALHRGLVVLNLLISILGAAAAVGLGFRFAGAIGGLVLGSLFAVVPIFLGLSEMTRPYSMAWSFGIIALYFASSSARRWMLTALFLGLSIASRIEMLCLIPLVWWVFWVCRGSGGWKRSLIMLTLLSLCVATWTAPWLMTHLIGNLRTIATVRFAGGATQPWHAALLELVFRQGLGVVVALALVGCFLQPPGARVRVGILAAYTLLLTISMLRGFADGIHQHGAVLIAWMLLLVVTVEPMRTRWPRGVAIGLAIALAFPLVQTVLQIRWDRLLHDRDESVAWVQQHVPSGTTVYLIDYGQRSLLPTPQAATALWTEVTDDQAWRKKVQSGLSRFNLSAQNLPRALSEENLIQERSNRRKWFILGGRTDLPIPRYNVRLVAGSPVFGIHDLSAAMKDQSGVLIWRDGYHIEPPDFLGPPLRVWGGSGGPEVRAYCTPDLRARLAENPNG